MVPDKRKAPSGKLEAFQDNLNHEANGKGLKTMLKLTAISQSDKTIFPAKDPEREFFNGLLR